MDALEKYITENRKAFDLLSPPYLGEEGNPPSDSIETFTWLYRSKMRQFENKDFALLWKRLEQRLAASGPLENWIGNHEGAFDQHQPSALSWDKIEAKLSEPKPETKPQGKSVTISVQRLWQVAAVVALLITAGVSAYFWKGNPESPLLSNRQAERQEGQLTPELSETELYYQMVIHEKLEKIKQFDQGLSERIRKDFFKELSALDDAYQDMKRELAESQNNEQVISGMINNLQLRIDVLNKQLEILQQIESKNENQPDDEEINL